MTGLEATLLGAAAKETFAPIKDFIKSRGLPAYQRLVVEYSRCFDSHLAASKSRCSNIKNILYRDERVSLRSQYTHVSFQSGPNRVEDKSLLQSARQSERFIISGTAGAGKTMFMKWYTLLTIESILEHQRIPLFIELRNVKKDPSDQEFVDFLFSSTSAVADRASLADFETGLELGQFIIVLDAIDEVASEFRANVVRQIESFARRYPKCTIIVSTRPDEIVESLQDFRVFHTVDMTEGQIIEVIDKLEYDKIVKANLIDKLKNGLFAKHQEFLSNPLLATIMLLTFDQSADIPTKLTAFYKQAFEALYQRHDAAKGAYRRGHYAGLPLDEYEKIFSVFCYDSYVNVKVSFSDTELLQYFTEAKTFTQINVKSDDLVKDAMQSVCVIQRDGLVNTFVHRSFQEYFAALFLSRYSGSDLFDLIESVVIFGHRDTVLKMLIEIAPEMMEEKWIEPRLRPLIDEIRLLDVTTIDGLEHVFTKFYASINIDIESGHVHGFGNTFSPSDEQAGSWLGQLGLACNPPRPLSRRIFDNVNVFAPKMTLIDLLNSSLMPKSEINDIVRRVEKTPDNDDDGGQRQMLSVKPGDSRWLINSKFASQLGAVRTEVVSYYDDVLQSINNRKNAIQKLARRRLEPSSETF